MSDYIEFLVYDLEKQCTIEHSCNPNCLKYYMQKLDLPLEVCPVFFNKEVFSKYKFNKEKYSINNRYIERMGHKSCF